MIVDVALGILLAAVALPVLFVVVAKVFVFVAARGQLLLAALVLLALGGVFVWHFGWLAAGIVLALAVAALAVALLQDRRWEASVKNRLQLLRDGASSEGFPRKP